MPKGHKGSILGHRVRLLIFVGQTQLESIKTRCTRKPTSG